MEDSKSEDEGQQDGEWRVQNSRMKIGGMGMEYGGQEDLCYHIKEDNIGIAYTNCKALQKICSIHSLDILFPVFSGHSFSSIFWTFFFQYFLEILFLEFSGHSFSRNQSYPTRFTKCFAFFTLPIFISFYEYDRTQFFLSLNPCLKLNNLLQLLQPLHVFMLKLRETLNSLRMAIALKFGRIVKEKMVH